jgi:PleD family two-component response regulator
MRAGLAVAMRFRSYLARQLDRQGLPAFTASIGIATRPDHGRSIDGVLRAAEQAAFDAKDAGRDQIVPASSHSALDDDLG